MKNIKLQKLLLFYSFISLEAFGEFCGHEHDMVKRELRVTSCELRVASYKLKA